MATKMKDVLFGCDPEYACFKADSDTPVGAWLVTSGRKEDHELVGEGIEIHADGVALEFNVPPASADPFRLSLIYQKQRVHNIAEERGYILRAIPEAEGFSKDALMHPLAYTIGCDPDFCAYDDDSAVERKVPFDPLRSTKRFFGGHIHVGYDTNMMPDWALVRVIELTTYLQFLHKDDQKDRRKVYGLAGLFRHKSYGLEYRTPSNFWLDGKGHKFIESLTYNTFHFLDYLHREPKNANNWFNRQPWKDIKRIVDECDWKSAKKIVQETSSQLGDMGCRHYSLYNNIQGWGER